MTENKEFLTDKMEGLGEGTIMGAMEKFNTDTLKGEVDKLQEAIDTQAEVENKEINPALINGNPEQLAQLAALRRTRPIVRDNKKIGRNDPCPCGALDSNGKPKKYKNCCMNTGRYETTHFE